MKNLIVLFTVSLFLFYGCQREDTVPVFPQSDTKTDISKNLNNFDINIDGIITTQAGTNRCTMEGSGHSSQFGEFTCYMDGRILNDALRNNVSGILVITTIEGDEIKSEFSGNCHQTINGMTEYDLSMIITEASGKFEGATGRMHFNGEALYLTPMRSMISLEGTGWIN